MLVEINETDMKEFLDWANGRAFCNSGQHICDRLATIFEGTPAEDRYGREPFKAGVMQVCNDCVFQNKAVVGNCCSPIACKHVLEKVKQNQEWICSRCGHRNAADNEVCMGAEMGDGRCGKPKEKVKPLAQYLDEYIEHEYNEDNIGEGIGVLYAWDSWHELLEQALDAYESTENVKIRIERV